MQAFKCDRCGKYMDSTMHMFKFTYFVLKGNRTGSPHLDLCRECMAELNDWMDEKQEGEEDDSED